MDPLTLQFNVFQAGAQEKRTLSVADPKSTTILLLKRQLFEEELKAGKNVRFIANGKMLGDTTTLGSCGLGNQAHIHVSVSDAVRQAPSEPTSPTPSNAVTSSAQAAAIAPTCSETTTTEPVLSWMFVAATLLFIGTGAVLLMALRKRFQYSMNTSQWIFIGSAVWVYLLVFHGLPALFEVLSKLGNSSSAKDAPPRTAPVNVVPTAVPAAPVEDSSSSSAPASPGLSLMTPTLQPGSTPSSVLTQRTAVAA